MNVPRFFGRRGPVLLTSQEQRAIRRVTPRTPNQLHEWLRLVADVDVPRRVLRDGSSAPFEYVRHAFFEDQCEGASHDCVVWANRGGGKTFYGALATMLDLVFKPGIEVRVLGGSLEQAHRMHEHLRLFFARASLCGLVDGRITDRRIRLVNGSRCELLAQSPTSVRGARPQKLRCDEVELFDPEIWRAAQLAPRSKQCGSVYVHGAVEALSTMHRPGGLMQDIVAGCSPDPATNGAQSRLFRWSVVDVLAACPARRPCDPCGLRDDCGGAAKAASGHVPIDDALAMQRRSARAVWEAEMLCLRPSRTDAVFPEFDASKHVTAFDPPSDASRAVWVGGMDFGFRAPAVFLWAFVGTDGAVRVADERVVEGEVLDAHIQAVLESDWPRPSWVGIDPAGRQRSDQTGVSAATAMRRSGLVVRDRRAPFVQGLGLVRARLAPASGSPSLWIHPRCASLIRSLETYRYGPGPGAAPVKDGPDHAADALRYMLVGLDLHRPVQLGSYL